jgi:hypothetical protein
MTLLSQHDDYVMSPIEQLPKPLAGSRIWRSDGVVAEAVPLIQESQSREKRSGPQLYCITRPGTAILRVWTLKSGGGPRVPS